MTTNWLGMKLPNYDSLLKFSLGDAYQFFKSEDEARKVAEQLPPGSHIAYLPDRQEYALSLLATEAQLSAGILLSKLALTGAANILNDQDTPETALEFILENVDAEWIRSITNLTKDFHAGSYTILSKLHIDLDDTSSDLTRAKLALESMKQVTVPRKFIQNLPVEACEALIATSKTRHLVHSAIGNCPQITLQNSYRIFALYLGLNLARLAGPILGAKAKGTLAIYLRETINESDLALLEAQAAQCFDTAATRRAGYHDEDSTALYILLLASIMLHVGIDLIPFMDLDVAIKSTLAVELERSGNAGTLFFQTLNACVQGISDKDKEELLRGTVLNTFGCIQQRSDMFSTAAKKGMIPENTKPRLIKAITPYLAAMRNADEESVPFENTDVCEFLSAWVTTNTTGLIPGIGQPLGCPELLGILETAESYSSWMRMAELLIAKDGKRKTINAKVIRAAMRASGSQPLLQEYAPKMIGHILQRCESISKACSVSKQYKPFVFTQPGDELLSVIAPSYVWGRDAAYTE